MKHVDRQRRYWSEMSLRGEKRIARLPFTPPSLTKLQGWAKVHPLVGSFLQGSIFGLSLLAAFLVISVPLMGRGNGRFVIELTVLLAALGGVVFGVVLFRYNMFVKKHGEPN